MMTSLFAINAEKPSEFKMCQKSQYVTSILKLLLLWVESNPKFGGKNCDLPMVESVKRQLEHESKIGCI